MRQAADILASPAAMQIRQLEALQSMAKTASSKVVFVPMQLQSDVISQVSGGAGPSGSGGAGHSGSVLRNEVEESTPGAASRAGILSSIADV